MTNSLSSRPRRARPFGAWTWLGLAERDALAADAGVSPEGSGYNGFSLAHNVASEEEGDRTLEQAVAAGATLVKPAKKASWGGYSRYSADPDGNLWEVAHWKELDA